jgi:hypothetical protein
VGAEASVRKKFAGLHSFLPGRRMDEVGTRTPHLQYSKIQCYYLRARKGLMEIISKNSTLTPFVVPAAALRSIDIAV